MDKEKLIKEFEEICNYTMRPHEFRVLNDVLVLLKEQEAKIEQLNRFVNGFSRDAIPVVRCKDCEYATMTADGKMCKYCEMDTDDFGDQREVYHDADWFCADGERG